MANRKGTARADAAVVAGKTGSRAAGQAPRKHKKTALWKDIRRSIAHSKGRFISIMLLMMLGSFALVGLFVAGPDMRATGETYFNEYSLSDLTVMSDYGLDGEDVSTINKTQGTAAIEYGYFKDVTIDRSTKALRVESKPDKVSQLELVDGRMPQKKGEIAIDSHIGKDYPIGSTIKLDDTADQLADGEKQIADSKATLADAKGQLADGQSQLDSAWDQLEAGRAQLESGRADLDANWPKLVSANNLINQNQRPTTPR